MKGGGIMNITLFSLTTNFEGFQRNHLSVYENFMSSQYHFRFYIVL